MPHPCVFVQLLKHSETWEAKIYGEGIYAAFLCARVTVVFLCVSVSCRSSSFSVRLNMEPTIILGGF